VSEFCLHCGELSEEMGTCSKNPSLHNCCRACQTASTSIRWPAASNLPGWIKEVRAGNGYEIAFDPEKLERIKLLHDELGSQPETFVYAVDYNSLLEMYRELKVRLGE